MNIIDFTFLVWESCQFVASIKLSAGTSPLPVKLSHLVRVAGARDGLEVPVVQRRQRARVAAAHNIVPGLPPSPVTRFFEGGKLFF